MTRPITVGLDGSPQSVAAADWAAREALSRDLPLRLVNASVWQTPVFAPATGTGVPVPSAEVRREYARSLLDEARAHLAERHPGLRIDADELAGEPVTALLEAGRDAELLVLGSRGLGRVAGFLLGSVSLAVLAAGERPVVLVRPGAHTGEGRRAAGGDGDTVRRDIVLGLDLRKPSGAVIGFAFEAASRSAATLRVVHGWTLPPYHYGGDLLPEVRDDMAARVPRELSEVLAPWREKYPAVQVESQAVVGGAGAHLVDASRDAALVVVGRRVRRSAVGAHIGPVAQALLHHATAPVAVVPHE
ncbi:MULTISPECIES: universal stress protein [Streptomyces]|uniref:universal stress protein n=1 Tax=Streptomyces TaxID=1883 RepID=UPI0014079669|nr:MULTISPECIES: universal stress protein [Streptomyces]MDH6223848.1 nucleotide-binding universal stress UspA family protein [Streptomyces sp. MJP52]